MIIKLQDQLSPPAVMSAVMREGGPRPGPGTIGIISPPQTICSSLVCHGDNIVLIKPTKSFLHKIIEEFKHHRG